MQVPPSHGAIPKIKSPPQESVSKSQEGYDDLQPTKNKEFDLQGSNPTSNKDKMHSTHRHHKETQSGAMPSEEVVMHKDRPPSEHGRRVDSTTNDNVKQENREPKSASQKDRPNSERKHQGDELLVQRSIGRESKPSQKVRPHTERKHQADKYDDVSPSTNNVNDKDSRHGRQKVKHSGRKHHGDKHDDKMLTPKTSETNVNKLIADTTFHLSNERSQSERKQDSDAQKSNQSNVSKEKRKNKPSSIHMSNKIDKGINAEKYEGLPLAPCDNEKSKTGTIPNKEREISNHKNKKIISPPGSCCGYNSGSGKITKSNHDISLIFPDEDGNKSVMRIVVRSFASPTKSQNCVDVKIEGEKFNASSVKNPEIETLIRELTKYVILIQKRLENDGDESDKAKKEQQKCVEVIELFRRPDRTFGKKEVNQPTKSRGDVGEETKPAQETDNNKRSLQTNGNGEVDKTSKRKKNKKELKPESSRSKKGVEQESAMVLEDGKEANEEPIGLDDGEKSKENFQGMNEKRGPHLESDKSEGVIVDSQDKKEAKKQGSKKHNEKREVGKSTDYIPEGEDERRESNQESGQSDGDDLDLVVHKKQSKRKRISGESPPREDVSGESENILRGENERREPSPNGGEAEVSPVHERKIDEKNQGRDNIDNVNPKKTKTKCCTGTTFQNAQKKDNIKKTSKSPEEGSQVPKSTAGAKQDSKKISDKKMCMTSVKNSVSKMLVKLTASKTTVAEGLTAAIRQKHKAKEMSSKKSRPKVGEGLSSSKGVQIPVQIPVLFEEMEPTLQSKSSVKILLEHATEEGNLSLNLIGIRNDNTQDFGGRIEFCQSAMTAKKKCEDVETMKELLSNCVKKVENVLNNLYQGPNEAPQLKQSKKVKVAETKERSIEEAQDQKKTGGIMKSLASMDYASETNYEVTKISESNKSLRSSSSSKAERRISFREETVELPFLGMKQDSEISEEECSGGPNGECNECDIDEEDAQYTKEKDVNGILEAKLDAGEFDREARKSFQRELFSASLKDPDAIERYRRSHSKLSITTGGETTDQTSGVPDQTSQAPKQASDAPLWDTQDSLDHANSKTNLALSLSTEDKKTTTVLGISMWPDGQHPSNKPSIDELNTEGPSTDASSINPSTTKEPSTDASSIDQPISKVPSTDAPLNNQSTTKKPLPDATLIYQSISKGSVHAMIIEPETSQLESNAEPTGINTTPRSSIYETKSPMVMVSSVKSHSIFETQLATHDPFPEATSMNQSIYKGPPTSVYSMAIEPKTTESESNADPTGINPTPRSSIYETKSPMVMVSSVTSRPVFADSSGGEETRSDKKRCCQLF